MKIHVVLLLAVVNFIHCDECKLMFDLAIVEIGGSLRTIYNHLKGHDQLLQRIPDMQEKLEHLENNLQDMQEKLEHLENNLQDMQEKLEHLENNLQDVQEKLEHLENNLQGHDELLQRIPDMQQKFQHLENNLQDVQEKLEHLENNLQGLSQETGQLVRREVLEHLTNVSAAANEEIKSYVHEEIAGVISLAQDMQEKLQHLENNLQGLSRETAQCLKGEDLEHLTNVSAAANQEIKSFHEEMSEVIAWSRKDKCSEGGLPCGVIGTCENTLFSFTCSCPSGFTWDGSECKDVDECAEGKHECVPNAKCKNSIGSYSCSCNKPFEGDVRTSCEFQCRSPAERVPGVGCLLQIKQFLTFQALKKKCEEEGMRLPQHMSLQQLQDMGRSFGTNIRWVGVYDGKWTSDGSLVPEDLWWERYRSDPSRRCGYIYWDSSSSSYKLYQWDCSVKLYGYCQFPMP
ncbi:uncharacterized protein [Palaemon carinicauda]|uniref:uncharacterized protein isoform X6 n=1 Tax=Palaemon carinicauda TaxID=392227 RepID=UPI0035B5B85D